MSYNQWRIQDFLAGMYCPFPSLSPSSLPLPPSLSLSLSLLPSLPLSSPLFSLSPPLSGKFYIAEGEF